MAVDKSVTKLSRKTSESEIELELALGAGGKAEVETGIAFFDHMLGQLAKHSGANLKLKCKGDLEVDAHHSVEDSGIALGAALDKALSTRKGLARFGSAYAPLDESLARTVIDLSGRPGLFFSADFTRPRVGEFDTQLVEEFFRAFANHARATVHIDLIRGYNCHHQVEAIFKSFAIALARATAKTGSSGLPSTKGVI